MKKIGVYLGRFNPIHVGHGLVAQAMIEKFGIENCLVIIGSANAPVSLRHFFSYEERKNFIKQIFPDLRIVPLPDFHNDAEWIGAIRDLIRLAGADEAVFFGGCDEDLVVLLEADMKCRVINRFDGTTPKISATEIRDCLIYDRPLTGLVDERIAEKISHLFKQKWEKFKKI